MKMRVMGLMAAVVFVVAACGGGDSDTVADCEELADTSIATIQDVLDDLDGLTLAEQAALGSDDAPPLLADIEARFAALGVQAVALECADAEMSVLMQSRFGELSSQSDFGKLVLDQLSETLDDGGFFGSDGG